MNPTKRFYIYDSLYDYELKFGINRKANDYATEKEASEAVEALQRVVPLSRLVVKSRVIR